ncbi:MAG: hypothetical protein LRZ84_02410 [Desertifilum sp.]|nr:hypothetical protein [Desertifilum sp.]
MTSTPPTPNEPSVLGRFASIVGLLGAALFFTGWIYRWAYFAFFQLEITTLDLPVQSFFMVPIQVFLGNFKKIGQTALLFLVTFLAIYITLWLIHSVGAAIVKAIEDWRWQNATHYITKRPKSSLDYILQSFFKFNPINFDSVKFLQSLIDEIAIVSWVLIIFFWFARYQGTVDARRDAGQNSTLPVIALVTPEKRLALGRSLDTEDPLAQFSSPSLADYRIFGDRTLFNSIQGIEDNDLEQERIWRLLIERDGWIYLFITLKDNYPSSARPAVLAIQESNLGEQLMILSPSLKRESANQN